MARWRSCRGGSRGARAKGPLQRVPWILLCDASANDHGDGRVRYRYEIRNGEIRNFKDTKKSTEAEHEMAWSEKCEASFELGLNEARFGWNYIWYPQGR